MQKLTSLINKFSFSRKLACTFFVCSLVTFIIINIIMNVLYSTVVVSPNSDSALNTQAFSQFSNAEILSNAQAYLQSGMDVYQQIITQAHKSFEQFINNSDIYLSKERKNKNPALTQTFTTPRYDRSSIYFFTPNSTFYDHPFLDKVLSSSATLHFPNKLKRINCIYQSKTDPDDIAVRTVPATNDFYVPNSEIISNKIVQSKQGHITQSDWYYDDFSKADNLTQLISLRFLAPNLDYHLLFQVQIQKDILQIALNHVYSFPGTKLYLIKLLNASASGKVYSLLGKNFEGLQNQNLIPYIKDGSKNITIDGYQFLVTTRTLIDHNNDVSQQTQTQSQPQQEIQTTDLRLIIFLNKTQTSLPKIVYNQFLTNQYSTLTFILYGWSFVVLMVVVAIGIVIGDVIFSYFSLIRKKCRQYLHNSQQIRQIDQQLKQYMQNQPQRLLLFENIVSIMQCIQNKKKQNHKNFKISHDVYPLNKMGMNFQDRMKIKDYNRFQDIAHAIKQRQHDIR